MVEQSICNRQVAGSSPVGGSKSEDYDQIFVRSYRGFINHGRGSERHRAPLQRKHLGYRKFHSVRAVLWVLHVFSVSNGISDGGVMAYIPTDGTSRVYLNQWVKIASGNRVTLSGGVDLTSKYSSGNTGYFVFKCSQCQDNWHVGHDNFPNGNTVPSVLSDWVKKHRHVCKKFRNPPATSTGVCQSCMWPYGAHEESWMGVPGYDHTVTKSFLASLDQKNFPPKPTDEYMTLKQFTGRKFRDVEANTCESPDTNTAKT